MAKKVLVVDDEKLIVKGIRFSLLQDGMEVDCAYDGEEALNMAKANSYDMILLDVMLPKMDGFEVCQHAAKPTGVDIGHTAAGSLLTDGILRLLLRADEKDFLPVRCELAHKHIGLFQLAHGFLQINDIDAVALGEDILRHFGVPPTGLMAEVDTRFQ